MPADRPIAWWLWLGSTAFVIYGSALPFNFDLDTVAAGQRLNRAASDLVALVSGARPISTGDLVQNVLLLLPFGACGYEAVGSKTRRTWLRIAIVIAAGLALSVCAEAIQLFTRDRITSVRDVMFQAAGTVVGIVLAIVLRNASARWQRRAAGSAWARASLFYPVCIAAGITVVAAWEPFDLSLDVGLAWDKVKALRLDPWQRAPWSDELLQVCRYAALVVISSAWLEELRVRRPRLLALVSTAALGVSLEVSQLGVDARMPGLWDTLVNVTGAGLGVIVSFTWPALLSGAWKPTVIAASWFGTAMQMLSPFELERTRRGLSWLPFRSFAESNPSAIVSHAIELALVYVPVGIALACWLRSSRRHHIWNALAIVALMQAPIELAQGLIAGRYPDMTDIVLAVAGGFAGYSMQAAAVSTVVPLDDALAERGAGIHPRHR